MYKVNVKIQTFVSRGKSMDGMGKMKTSAEAESGLAEWDKFIYTTDRPHQIMRKSPQGLVDGD